MRVKYLLICIAALYISPETEIFICALRNSSKTFLQFILGGEKSYIPCTEPNSKNSKKTMTNYSLKSYLQIIFFINKNKTINQLRNAF